MTRTLWQATCTGGAVVSLPRSVHPGSVNMVTRRCTQRQFLLRPDPEANNAFLYCLAVAAQRYEIDVIGFIQIIAIAWQWQD